MLQWFRVSQKFSRKLQGVSKLLQKETGSCFYSPSGGSSVNRKEWKGLQKKQKQRYRIFKTVNGFIKTEQQIWNSNKTVRRKKSAWT